MRLSRAFCSISNNKRYGDKTMKDRRKYRKCPDNQRWLDGRWKDITFIRYEGIKIRGKKRIYRVSKPTCITTPIIVIVPILNIKQMSDERWNELARRNRYIQ